MPRRQSDAGQSTIEFALILPLFVLLLVTVVDVAVLARDQLRADAIARDAARTASTAATREEASSIVSQVVDASSAPVVSFDSIVRDGIITVRVAVAPRTSTTFGVVGWLSDSRLLVGEASFATEFSIDDG